MTVAALIAMVLSPALSAHATEGILLSNNGSDWSQTLAAPLFDESIRWVPGDERTARFYVRNDTDMAADMTVDILAGELEALLDTGDVYIDVRIDDGPWATTQTTGAYRLTQQGVSPNGTYPVDVRVRFVGASTNESQLLSFDLNIRVTLVQVVDPTTDPTRPLSQTGAAVGWSAIAISALTALTFAVVVARRRKREQEPSNEPL